MRMIEFGADAVRREIQWSIPTGGRVRQGAKDSALVQRAQEWLTLHGFPTSIDGDFGPATAAAIEAFRKKSGILNAPVGELDQMTWEVLTEPMRKAFRMLAMEQPASPAAPKWATAATAMPDAILQVGEAHLAMHPREVGGQNMGPWVRAYTGGAQGVNYPWCAAAATTIWRQASVLVAQSLGFTQIVLPATLSCDVLADWCAKHGKLFTQMQPKDAHLLTPGDLFFVVDPKNPNDRKHVGIVAAISGDGKVITTFEGNTNDEGSREGYEFCQRFRAVGKLDFGRWY